MHPDRIGHPERGVLGARQYGIVAGCLQTCFTARGQAFYRGQSMSFYVCSACAASTNSSRSAYRRVALAVSRFKLHVEDEIRVSSRGENDHLQKVTSIQGLCTMLRRCPGVAIALQGVCSFFSHLFSASFSSPQSFQLAHQGSMSKYGAIILIETDDREYRYEVISPFVSVLSDKISCFSIERRERDGDPSPLRRIARVRLG